jgi:flagellar motor switch protein FliM
MFMGEKFGRDSIWESHLATELWSTEIEIEAILEEQVLHIGEVMNLEVGSTIMLNSTTDSPIELRCGGVSLLEGKMGRVGPNIAVSVSNSFRNQGQ